MKIILTETKNMIRKRGQSKEKAMRMKMITTIKKPSFKEVRTERIKASVEKYDERAKAWGRREKKVEERRHGDREIKEKEKQHQNG